MKKIKLIAVLMSTCLLAACQHTFDGIGEDMNEASNWTQNKPAPAIEEVFGEAPRGYEPKQETQAPAVDDGRWATIDNYNAQDPSLPGDGQGGPIDITPDTQSQSSVGTPLNGIRYNRNVSVFPIDESISYAVAHPDGSLAEEVFFAHGSAQVGKADRKNLRELASSLKNNGPYSVNVVGHASFRVNGVDDPVQKRLINFKMAQKRADAVANVMTEAGMAANWVQATSAGDEQPNLNRGSLSQEAADRRAEVFVNNH